MGQKLNGARVTRFFIVITCCLFVSATSLAKSAAATLLIVGDSLSAAYGIQEKQGWVHLFEQKLQQQQPCCRVVNASISGATTAQGRQQLPQLMEKHQPRVVIIELGANDGLRGLSLTQMQTNLQAMIDLAQSQQAVVLLIAVPMPPNYGKAYVTGHAKVFEDLATNNDVALTTHILDNVADKRELMQADNLHPTAAAQAILLENLWPALLEVAAHCSRSN